MENKVKYIIIDSTRYELKYGNFDKYDGLISYYPCEISIKSKYDNNKKIAEIYQLRTLFHEIMHAIVKHRLDNMQVLADMTEEEEETLAEEVGNGFLNLLIYNPNLMDYVKYQSKKIFKEVKEKGEKN